MFCLNDTASKIIHCSVELCQKRHKNCYSFKIAEQIDKIKRK